MKKLTFLLVLLSTGIMSAQKEQKDVDLPEANAAFLNKEYKDAEAKYRVSQSKFPKKAVASYNLGNAIYRINQPSEARNAYSNAIENAKTRTEKHRTYHNLGNVLMLEKNYKAAVDAYKQALINNPADEETRYNYALAKKFLKENPPKDNKDKQDKKQDDKKPEQKDKNNEEDKDKDNPDKDSQNNKDKEKKEDPKSPKPKPEQGNGISKQRVENLLEAVNNEERKVQDKVNARKVKGKPVRTEKDW